MRRSFRVSYNLKSHWITSVSSHTQQFHLFLFYSFIFCSYPWSLSLLADLESVSIRQKYFSPSFLSCFCKLVRQVHIAGPSTLLPDSTSYSTRLLLPLYFFFSPPLPSPFTLFTILILYFSSFPPFLFTLLFLFYFILFFFAVYFTLSFPASHLHLIYISYTARSDRNFRGSR